MAHLTCLNQYLKNRNGRWHYCRRVPSAYEEFDSRGMIRVSLKTTSLDVARARRDALAEADELYWSSLVTGGDCASRKRHARYQAAKKRAMARGFLYSPVDELAQESKLEEILDRLDALNRVAKPEPADTEALLGGVEPVALPVSEAFELYCRQIAVSDLLGKSEAQKRSWRKAKNRAVKNFIHLCGDLPMDHITRKHAQQFRQWWTERLTPKDGRKALNPNSANRDIGNLRMLFQAYWAYEGDGDRTNPFDKLRFTGVVYKDVPPFDPDWVQTRILKPGMFDELNPDARLIIYALVETGCRPSEIANLVPDNIVLDHDIPHLQIRPRSDRKLKSRSSVRDIPLLGVSLKAFKQAPHGFPRYRDKGDALSALLLKAFRSRDLLPTEDHRIYSLRHSFEKRMLEAGLDYGLRCTLMGHHNNRPSYGDGGSLEYRRNELAKIVFPVPGGLFD